MDLSVKPLEPTCDHKVIILQRRAVNGQACSSYRFIIYSQLLVMSRLSGCQLIAAETKEGNRQQLERTERIIDGEVVFGLVVSVFNMCITNKYFSNSLWLTLYWEWLLVVRGRYAEGIDNWLLMLEIL